jgi:hypothetical protein
VTPITIRPIPMTSPTAGGMRKPVVLNMLSVPLGTPARAAAGRGGPGSA